MSGLDDDERLRVEPALDQRQPDGRARDHAGRRRERVEGEQLAVHDRRPPPRPARRSRPGRRPGCPAARRPRSDGRAPSASTRSAAASACSRASACRGARVQVSVSAGMPACARSAPCTTGSPAAAPERTSSRLTCAPASTAEAHAPRSDDSADTSAERRRSARLPSNASTAARASATAVGDAGQFEQRGKRIGTSNDASRPSPSALPRAVHAGTAPHSVATRGKASLQRAGNVGRRGY